MKIIKTGSDFSGVGAFDYAIQRVADIKGFKHERVFACDIDKFARQSYIANHGEPKYYPKDVYEREIPKESLDIYMTSPPCQAFSIAGNRKGKEDERGILFFNSHEFIKKNQPRFFIFENVKGLLSDDGGNTFQEWINLLGGKSVNGLPILFKDENAVDYHVYWKVLNSKKYGVPQNRERVFIIGIRDDQDNQFTWPKEVPLTKKLKDILESEVDEKYFLSDKMVSQLLNNGTFENENDLKVIGNTNPSGNGMNGNVFDENGIAPTLSTNKGEGIKIKSATKKGYETATENDSINFSVPNSETRRGRVGKEVSQTLDTQCNQGVMIGTWRTHKDGQGFRETSDNNCPTIPARAREDGSGQPVIMIEHRGHRDKDAKVITNEVVPCLRAESHGHETKICVPVLTPDRAEKRQNGRRFKEDGDSSFTLTAQDKHGIFDGFRIRRLTPRECFRLQDFPDSFKFVVSDSQLYKQAGNSITVKVLELIIDKLNL